MYIVRMKNLLLLNRARFLAECGCEYPTSSASLVRLCYSNPIPILIFGMGRCLHQTRASRMNFTTHTLDVVSSLRNT